ncbi:MAG: DUF4974 domain-containing protein [Cytophagaceae bacterium]|nr:DUF4974 domain-containing protein [Cytophagaceae bacterium]
MNKYLDYQAEDFVVDESFQRWARGTAPEDQSFWEEWLRQNPQRRGEIEQAKDLLNSLQKRHTHITDAEIEREVEKLLVLTAEVPVRSLDSGRLFSDWLRIAASVLLLVGAGWGVWHLAAEPGRTTRTATLHSYTDLVGNSPVALIERFNQSEKFLTVKLPDGSTVRLGQDSRLSYPPVFAAARREVYLTGRGYFSVTKRPEQPFLVYANGLVTKVLGTSFTINAPEEAPNVVVSVHTGRVSVYPLYARGRAASQGFRPNALFLTPNQQAFFVRGDEQLTKKLIQEPTLLEIPKSKEQFVFENAPIEEVFQTLQRAYGVAISYDTDLLKNCYLTAPLEEESLFEKLDIICKTIGATYEVIETQIVVTGKGCPP